MSQNIGHSMNYMKNIQASASVLVNGRTVETVNHSYWPNDFIPVVPLWEAMADVVRLDVERKEFEDIETLWFERRNTNIYKNIFPEEIFNMDIAYKYEQKIGQDILVITQENHGFSVGNVLCVINGVYQKARAEDSLRGQPVGVVSEVTNKDTFRLMKHGVMPYKEQTFTDTTILYLSNLAAGGMVHYKYVTNKIYIPIAFYMDGSILVNIQRGSKGADMAPYEEHESMGFEQYTESELNECIAATLGGMSYGE